MPVHDPSDQARVLYRNLQWLTGLTLVFLVALAIAPARSHFSEWRQAQKRYNAEAREAGMPAMAVGLQQVWRAELELADRCATCHVGSGPATPLAGGDPLFAAHPDVHHDVTTMGCTVCHRGQGRATTEQAAHGHVAHFDDPMLPTPFLQASCGGCHGDAIQVHDLAEVEFGQYAFELHGCRSCHVVDGDGGDVGPDLSGVALRGFDRAWHVRHLRDPVGTVEGSQMMSFGHLRDDEIDALLDYMDTLVGATTLVEGKALAVQHGCRGCHVMGAGGAGGDVGADLAEAAATGPHARDYSGVEGEHTLASWHRQHLAEPARVSPGSAMPAYDLPADQADALITYALSLRDPGVPLELVHADSVLVQLGGLRDHDTDGATLFAMYCSTCHGSDGAGQVVPSLDTTVPGVLNADLLATASTGYLRQTLDGGRPGRNMPSWGPASGLTDAERAELLSWMRDHRGGAGAVEEVLDSIGDADPGRGARRFAHRCAGCHGLDGEGTVIAPSASSAELLFAADDRYLAETVLQGHAGTAMPAHTDLAAEDVAELLAFLHAAGPEVDETTLAEQTEAALGVGSPRDYRAVGSQAYGGYLFASSCAGCHGPEGLGAHGPAIAGADFLRLADDGLIATTVALGRSGRPMRSFGPYGITPLAEREIADIVTWLRRSDPGRADEPGGGTAQGDSWHGADLYGDLCAGCHGDEAGGLTAPALRNGAFLDAASDGLLQATAARGRTGTPMRAWAFGGQGFAELHPQEINDIVAWIRSGDASR